MIVKSRVTGKHALSVFENFRSDRMLPKFRVDKKTQLREGPEDQKQSSGGFIMGRNESFEMEMNGVLPRTWGMSDNDSKSQRTGVRRRIVNAIERLLGLSTSGLDARTEVFGKSNPLEVLLSVRGSLQEAKDYTDRVKSYDGAIKQALAGGQTARATKLMKARQVVQQESLLLVAGFKQYLSEQQVIEFASKCQKGLRLDWVENFGRPIPDSALKRKVDADSLKVFDNYVVLHYDPKAEAFLLTPAQVAAKKDPILFGVIEDVRKLYFIGDWKDDECDLTMEEVSKVLGHPSSEISPDPTVEP